MDPMDAVAILQKKRDGYRQMADAIDLAMAALMASIREVESEQSPAGGSA